jgi:hypothetical protein
VSAELLRTHSLRNPNADGRRRTTVQNFRSAGTTVPGRETTLLAKPGMVKQRLHNKGVQLTAYSVRCAPASGSS